MIQVQIPAWLKVDVLHLAIETGDSCRKDGRKDGDILRQECFSDLLFHYTSLLMSTSALSPRSSTISVEGTYV